MFVWSELGSLSISLKLERVGFLLFLVWLILLGLEILLLMLLRLVDSLKLIAKNGVCIFGGGA